MDTLGIEPRASRMLSGCDAATPCALTGHSEATGRVSYLGCMAHPAISVTGKGARTECRIHNAIGIACRFASDTLAEWLRRRPAKPMGSPRVGSNPTGVVCRWHLAHVCLHTTVLFAWVFSRFGRLVVVVFAHPGIFVHPLVWAWP